MKSWTLQSRITFSQQQMRSKGPPECRQYWHLVIKGFHFKNTRKCWNPGWSELFPYVRADTLWRRKWFHAEMKTNGVCLEKKTGGEREGAKITNGGSRGELAWSLAESREVRVFSLISVREVLAARSRTLDTFSNVRERELWTFVLNFVKRRYWILLLKVHEPNNRVIFNQEL